MSPPLQTDVLASRTARIAQVAYTYADQPKAAVGACNFCGGRRFTVIAHRDRYGYPAKTSACAACGLVFLNPVMTAGAYQEFYARIYRPLVSAYHGRRIDAETIQEEQRGYAQDLGEGLAPWLAGAGARTLLDIGGSTGIVAHELAQRFELRATVLDPAPLELDKARALGLETISGLLETFAPPARSFDLIVMCQTADHLLDVAGAMRKVRALIAPAGLFFVDIVDLRAAYLRHWSVEGAIKVDHPYYLTEPTIEAYLARFGFETLQKHYASDHLHIGYICRPAAPQPGARPSPESIEALLREMRLVQNAPREGR